MTGHSFRQLLHHLANAWRSRNYKKAVSFFSDDVRYADPLRYQFSDSASLLSFFEADEGNAQLIEWHQIMFDEERQVGMAEYTYEGTYKYHGVAIIKVYADKITHWREYQHTDPRDWQAFTSGTAF